MALTNTASLVNLSRDTVVAEHVEIARTIWSRARGLMLRSDFERGSALVIDPCSSIHMFFMRFPIDVLYVDKRDRVVRVQRGIKPWRIGPLRTKGSHYVVELPTGTVEQTGTSPGDQIEIRFRR
jgi:hypothetical protein